ncbi:MAG: FGGY-family carbohydrate kinase [Rhizobiales bacterium]|nr:FGGY-family carbohydrate kinase [Hyphomicrobiales bacterium]
MFLGLDIGTTSTIGILIELPDRVVGIESRPVTFSAPKAGWAEEDPREWWENVRAILAAFADRGVDLGKIEGIGVTGMLPAVVLLDNAGQLIRPSIQQSDGRCGAEVELLKQEVDPDRFLRKAGNGINQQLVTAKLRWIERHEPENFARIATVFGSYDYINWRLTGRRAIEQNWALEAGFVDLDRLDISPDLVALAHIPPHALPPRSVSHSILGAVTAEAAAATGLTEGTPVVGGAADLIASALGAGLSAEGDVLLKFGGSVDVLVATDKVAPDARTYLDHHLVPGLWVPNGCMATGGSGLNWFVRTFAGAEAVVAAGKGLTTHAYLDQLAAETPPGADGLFALPYFLGEKTPIHDPLARGIFHGISLSHGLPHFWRALLEGYAYAVAHHIEVMRDMGHQPQRYLVSDGGSNSRLWMQIVADVLQAPLQTLTGHPGSCLGAAWTAAVGTGATTDWGGVSAFVHRAAIVEPRPEQAELYRAGYHRFRRLYADNFAGAPS